MRLALCQLNATVGDIDGNAQRIRAGLLAAREAGAELALFPELSITGYPPEDLLLREDFLADAGSALRALAARPRGRARPRPTPAASSPWSASPSEPRMSTTPRPCSRTARCTRSTERCTCPT